MDDNLFPDDTIYSWNYPAASSPSIRSFLSLQYGDYDDGDPQLPIVSSRLGDLQTLTENVGFSMTGDTAGFDVINDMFLTTTAGGGNAHADEVEVFFSTPGYTQTWLNSLATLGSVSVSGINWAVYAATANGVPDYIIVPANYATVTGSVDLASLLQYLVSDGKLSGSLYFNGMAFGVETESGAGSMTLSNYSIKYSTKAVTPLVSIGLQDATGSVVSSQFYTTDAALIGKAEAGATVAIYNGSTLLADVTANSAGSWSYTPGSLSNGYNDLIATETDAYGNSATASVVFQLDTNSLNLSQSIEYVKGQGTNDIYTKIPTLNGWTVPSATVTLYDGATELTQITANSSGYWSYTPKSLTSGFNDIVATAHDIYGRTASDSDSFLYYASGGSTYATVPTVGMNLEHATGSLQGTTIYTTDADLVGIATPNAVVTIYSGNTKLGTSTADASGAWSFSPTNLTNGNHGLTANVTAANGLAANASLSIMFDGNPMNLSETIESVSGQGSLGVYTVDPTLNGWTTPGANVYLSDGTTYLGAVAANSSGQWTYQTQNLAVGMHDIVASAHDTYGRSANTAVAFNFEA